MKKYLPWIVALIIVLIVVGWFFAAYNSFVRLNEDVNTQWAQVENQYQRRADVLPNLMRTVEGIRDQEQAVFVGVAEARSRVGQIQVSADNLNDVGKMTEFFQAQNGLSQALSRLMVTVEAYPELKSDANFMALQKEIEGTENRLANERRRFNEMVREYNIKAKGIPGRWLVSLFGFETERVLFESVEGSDVAPVIDFSDE
ncbi:LemA family protein [Candidatus Peregrinibacteria bacterium]|jgi:LemA protein|nr:LemA family protein [Candidatus Peregrinibacteria bacterium]MBT4056271.1 LemA family protein [Candidatus Peregrinibacteria bacterium]